MKQNGRPDLKWTAALTWNLDKVTVGAFTQYISSIDDTNLLDSAGAPWAIDSQFTASLYAEYDFTDGWASNTKVKLGVRNLTDEQPPLSSSGYLGTVYQPYGRYWYASIRKKFQAGSRGGARRLTSSCPAAGQPMTWRRSKSRSRMSSRH